MSIQQQLRKQRHLEIITMIMIHPGCLISTDKIVRLNSRKYGLSQALYAAHQRQACHLDPGVQACKLLLLDGLVNTVASQGR